MSGTAEPGQRQRPSGTWQVFLRVHGRFYSTTFPATSTLTERRAWRDRIRLTARYGLDPPVDEPTFAHDAERYLGSVTAMAGYQDRRQHIEEWVAIFGRRRRSTIRPSEIRRERDRLLTTNQPRKDRPYAASSVNHRLRALRNLWTVLDGRHAPNPVREVPEADEVEEEPRALPYRLIRMILDAMPDIGRPIAGHRTKAGSQTKARLWVLAWTGLSHTQLMHLRPEDVDWKAPSIYVRARRKGRHGTIRQGRRKPITPEAMAALRRFDALQCWGRFSRDSMRASFKRACVKVEAALARAGTPVDLSTVRVYDLRHSFATMVLAATQDLETTRRCSTPICAPRRATPGPPSTPCW